MVSTPRSRATDETQHRRGFASRSAALVALLGVWLFLPTGSARGADRLDRPNIIVMVTDDQRWDALGCAGHPFIKTPNMDRLAAEGARFKNMFVVNTLNGPSQATLLTGLYSHAHRAGGDDPSKPIFGEAKLVSDYLREAGYRVAFYGKSHLAGSLRARQWDEYFGCRTPVDPLRPVMIDGATDDEKIHQGYIDDLITDRALKFIDEKNDRPFAVFIFFNGAQRSWLRPRRHHDLYRDPVVMNPDTYDEDLKDYPGKPKAFVEADNKIGEHADVRNLESLAKDYCTSLTAVDENVGRIVNALEKSDRLRSTALFLTSDGGFFLGEWRAFGNGFMHEPAIRVPLLLRYPRAFPAGSTPDSMSLSVDLVPTILELAGIPAPTSLHGRSLVAVAGSIPSDWRKDWLYESGDQAGPSSVKKHRGVRTTRFKYIHYYESPEEFELYNVEVDPQEKVNLYGQDGYAELTQQLSARIDELRKAVGNVDAPAAVKP
ncbi:MAG TPA: sulfatase-like hydrolase/transferase [Pirellulales bacterium]